MKKGTKVRFRRSYITFLEEHILEFHGVGGKLFPRHGVSLAADALLVAGMPYKARTTGRFGMDEAPEVEVDFGRGIKSRCYYEKDEVRKAK